MAKRWGVAAQTVHNWLVAAGVPRRPSPAAIRADVFDDQIIRLYTWGHTATEIADRLGCSTSLVYFRLERPGHRPPPPCPRHGVRPADAELAHLYWDCGLSLRDLAGRYGVSRRAVHNWLIAAGIDRRPQRTAPAVCDGDDPVALYRAGWSAPAIAERAGCSPSTIDRRLYASGVSRRPVRPRVCRHDLIEALDQGLSASDTAAALGSACRACAAPSPANNSRPPSRPRDSGAGSAFPSSTAEPPLPLPTSASTATLNAEALPLLLTVDSALRSTACTTSALRRKAGAIVQLEPMDAAIPS
jgi:transposase